MNLKSSRILEVLVKTIDLAVLLYKAEQNIYSGNAISEFSEEEISKFLEFLIRQDFLPEKVLTRLFSFVLTTDKSLVSNEFAKKAISMFERTFERINVFVSNQGFENQEEQQRFKTLIENVSLHQKVLGNLKTSKYSLSQRILSVSSLFLPIPLENLYFQTFNGKKVYRSLTNCSDEEKKCRKIFEQHLGFKPSKEHIQQALHLETFAKHDENYLNLNFSFLDERRKLEMQRLNDSSKELKIQLNNLKEQKRTLMKEVNRSLVGRWHKWREEKLKEKLKEFYNKLPKDIQRFSNENVRKGNQILEDIKYHVEKRKNSSKTQVVRQNIQEKISQIKEKRNQASFCILAFFEQYPEILEQQITLYQRTLQEKNSDKLNDTITPFLPIDLASDRNVKGLYLSDFIDKSEGLANLFRTFPEIPEEDVQKYFHFWRKQFESLETDSALIQEGKEKSKAIDEISVEITSKRTSEILTVLGSYDLLSAQTLALVEQNVLPTSIPKPRVFCEKPRIQRLNEFEMITQDSSFVNDQIKEMIYFLEQKHEDYTAYVLNLNPSEQNKIKMFVSKQTGQCYIFCDSVEKNDTIVFFHQIEEKLKNCDPTHIFECSEPKITFIMPAFKNPQEQEKWELNIFEAVPSLDSSTGKIDNIELLKLKIHECLVEEKSIGLLDKIESLFKFANPLSRIEKHLKTEIATPVKIKEFGEPPRIDPPSDQFQCGVFSKTPRHLRLAEFQHSQAWADRIGREMIEMSEFLRLSSKYKAIQINRSSQPSFDDFVFIEENTNKHFMFNSPTTLQNTNSVGFSNQLVRNISPKLAIERLVNLSNPLPVEVQVFTPFSNNSHWRLQVDTIRISPPSFTLEVVKEKRFIVDSLSQKGNLDGSRQNDSWSCGWHTLDNIEYLTGFKSYMGEEDRNAREYFNRIFSWNLSIPERQITQTTSLSQTPSSLITSTPLKKPISSTLISSQPSSNSPSVTKSSPIPLTKTPIVPSHLPPNFSSLISLPPENLDLYFSQDNRLKKHVAPISYEVGESNGTWHAGVPCDTPIKTCEYECGVFPKVPRHLRLDTYKHKPNWYSREHNVQCWGDRIRAEMQEMLYYLQNSPCYTLIPLTRDPTAYNEYIFVEKDTNRHFMLACPNFAENLKNVGTFSEILKRGVCQSGGFNPFASLTLNDATSSKPIELEVLTPYSNGSHWRLHSDTLLITPSTSAQKAEGNTYTKFDITNIEVLKERSRVIDSLKGNLDGTKQWDGWSCGWQTLDNLEYKTGYQKNMLELERKLASSSTQSSVHSSITQPDAKRIIPKPPVVKIRPVIISDSNTATATLTISTNK